MKLTHILRQLLEEQKKKEDRCKRIADRKYDKPSAYKSGAIVRCRQGKIWKDLKEEVPQSGESSGAPAKFKPGTKPEETEFLTLDQILQQVKGIPYYKEVLDDMKKGNESWGVTKKVKEYAEYMKKNPSSLKNLPPIIVVDKKIQDGAHRISAIYLLQNLLDSNNPLWSDTKLKVEFWNSKNLETGDYTFLDEDESLHKWFKRKGTPGKEGGWVDCNTCRNGKCKSCGRKKGEKRAKYPSCRPTPAQCKKKGKGKTWGKTK